MIEVCGDNRFEIIEKAKKDLLESTNINTDENEMKVIDNFLFRCWQMGWLEKYEQPQADKWIPCEERLPECESGCETKALMYQLKGTDSIEIGYYGEGGHYRNRYFRTYRDSFEGVDVSDVVAWQPLPQPYKKEGAE